MSDAGPSNPPSPATRPSNSDATSRTPAPTRLHIPPLAPDAPRPKPHAQTLPDATPLSARSPTAGMSATSASADVLTPSRVGFGGASGYRAVAQGGIDKPDVSEFDPLCEKGAADRGQGEKVSPELVESAQVEGQAAQTSKAKETEDPPFNFSGFLKDLRSKPAEPIARYLKSFLSNFAKKPFTTNEQIKLIHDFLRFIAEKMLQLEPWKSQTEGEFENALEAMEKLVMNRLYNYTFTPQLVPTQPITTDDLERDAVFAQRVKLFGWVQERHLDVPEGEASQGFLGFAEQELVKINHYKAPRDKMICILNCCKVIFGLLRHTGSGGEATSADAFVPILIFVVLRANPEHLLSNVEYINRFRSADKLRGEAGYYLSSLSGAIAFIESMDASSLSNISQDEFEVNVEKAVKELPPSPTSSTRPSIARDGALATPTRLQPSSTHGTPSSSMSPFTPAQPGEEAARPLTFPSLSLDHTRRFLSRTSNMASEAVSKPLNAIGKILEGMQPDGSEDGSGDEAERARRPRHQRQGTPTPEGEASRFAQLGISADESLPVTRSGTPMRDGQADYYSSLPPPPHYAGPTSTPRGNQDDPYLQTTLDESSEAYAATRNANVQTLRQMFPALDEEVLDVVLSASGDDLGLAIDRLLEM